MVSADDVKKKKGEHKILPLPRGGIHERVQAEKKCRIFCNEGNEAVAIQPRWFAVFRSYGPVYKALISRRSRKSRRWACARSRLY